MSGINCLLTDARGVYLPRDFVDCFDLSLWEGISAEDAEILAAGPEHENYWDAWSDVLDNASYADSSGNVWRLYQDGDLFAVCDALMTPEERDSFCWEG